MLQSIRKNIQGTVAKIIVGLIIVPFALFGIESLIGGGGAQNVAEINGQAVSALDLQEQINLQKRRLMMSLGENLDPGMLDDQVLAGSALEFIVQKVLMLQAAESYNLAVADERLNDMITEMPVFLVDGQFDPQRYRQILSDQAYTPSSFRKVLREDVLMTQLRTGLSGSEFVTPTELDQMAVISEERRDLRYLYLPISQFKDANSVSAEEQKQWYQDHSQNYQTIESVDLEYIELKLADFIEAVPESEILELFELEKSDMVLPEVRDVSHILFEQAEDESDTDLQARIAEVANLAKADASHFGELAKLHSQDLGSANFGGQLGFTDGTTFPDELESAIAIMAENQVSEAVESDSGWHLLLVTDIRAGETPSFDEMRFELEARVSRERASRKLVSASESLRDIVFNAEDLAGPAQQLGFNVSQREGVNRGTRDGAFADARVTNTAFSPELLAEGFNSDVIELTEEHYIVLRVASHHPAQTRPLELVSEQVIDEILESQAKDKAAEFADKLLLELQSGQSIEEMALAGSYEWQVELGATRDNRNVPEATLERAFQLKSPTDSPSFDYVQTVDGDIEIFELFRVSTGNIEKIAQQRLKRLEDQLGNESAQGIDAAYQTTLSNRAEVVRS